MFGSWDKQGEVQEDLYNYKKIGYLLSSLFMKSLLSSVDDTKMENMFCSEWVLVKT